MTTDRQQWCCAQNNNTNSRYKFLNPLTMRRLKTRTTPAYALVAMTSYVLISTMLGPAASASLSKTADGQHHQSQQHQIWRIISRAEWHALPPVERHNFTGPAPYVILHHSYQPGVCLTPDACMAAMRSMQRFHMDEHGWPDIGYSYAVGGDGNVYEGRGFNVIGAHAPKYNGRSIGLLLIGNFVDSTPPGPMMQVAQEFLDYAVEMGHLRDDYILYGHRQVRNTECPGEALYKEIQKWPHYKEQTDD